MNSIDKAFLKYRLINSLKSPSFYILSVLFTLFVSANYFIRQQFFTNNGTTDLLLYFTAVPYICIIIIPALCYKTSFEVYDCFIPQHNWIKIILSFASNFILFFVMIALLLPGAICVNLFGSADAGQITACFITLLFYGASVISICLFFNKLTENKIASLLESLIVLAILNSAHLYTLYIAFPAFLSSLFKQLSFAWHFNAAGKGIIDSRDLSWYLGITALFIALAAIIDEYKKDRRFTRPQKMQNHCILLLIILFILNGSRWYFRLDLSKNKIYSPSAYTKQLLNSIEQPLKITYFRSSSILKLYPQIKDVGDYLSDYSSISKKISLLIKDPDADEKLKTLLQNYGITSQQLRSVKKTSTEYTEVYSAIVLEYQGNVEIIPFVMQDSTLEYDLDGRIMHLVSGKERFVNIIVGNGMSLNEDYSYVVPWLKSQGFLCNQLFAEDPMFASELSSASGPLLVFGDSNIKIDAAIAIENYILCNKGNALLAVSPFSVMIDEDWSLTAGKNTNLVEMIENWGVKFTDAIAADVSCSRITMVSEDQHTQVLNYSLWPVLLPQKNAPHGITLFWPAELSLEQEKFAEESAGLSKVEPYLLTSDLSYVYEIDRNSPQKLIETNPFVLETYSISEKSKKQRILGAQIQGQLNGLYNLISSENSLVLVIPDQYFVNSLMTGYIGGESGDYRNFEFLTNALLKLNDENQLAQLQSRSLSDKTFYKISDANDFLKKRNFVLILVFALLPLGIIIFGVVFYVKKD